MSNSDKIILDLCGGTGAWSRPYKEAGYDVRLITLPDYSVEMWNMYDPKPLKELVFLHNSHAPGSAMVISTDKVYGILAAPPCTMFSIARTTANIARDFEKGMKTVRACLEIIWSSQGNGEQPRLKFWAIENPAMGYLRQFLGEPAYIFEPTWFGDSHTKKTALWGRFKKPERKPVRLNFGDKLADYAHHNMEIPEGYTMPPDMTPRQVRRSITPPGFARAFKEANP